MKYLTDANVLSEPTKPSPDSSVVAWLRRNERHLVVDPIILGEVLYGILRLPKGRRRSRLETWYAEGVARIACLPWDAETGIRWATLLAQLRAKGSAIPIKYSLIAATALAHGLTVATRNHGDFEAAGVPVIDPFELASPDPD